MNISQLTQIQSRILSRYEKEGRQLPWRATQDPYLIHISEVMSQQTQVGRVIPYWEKWIADIPHYGALASLEKAKLLAYWSGLGFNSRALRLQECAQLVVEEYQGELPRSRTALLQLPGIGPYTASAICAFAWNMEEPVVDTNIRRVLIFLFKLPETISLAELEDFARKIIPEGRSRDWHNALMDYGAMHLTAKKTQIKSLGKQSKFEGSDRQVRGWVIKQLVQKGSLSIEEIQLEFPRKDVSAILQGLLEENLIARIDKENVWIA